MDTARRLLVRDLFATDIADLAFRAGALVPTWRLAGGLRAALLALLSLAGLDCRGRGR
jgi:hypothetical protein